MTVTGGRCRRGSSRSSSRATYSETATVASHRRSDRRSNRCVIGSPVEQPAVLRLGFDRTLTAEWNGQKILGPVSRKIAVRDEYSVPVTLKAGENRLRLTVADDTLAYGFFARLSSPAGALMKDVTVTP